MARLKMRNEQAEEENDQTEDGKQPD